jgi:hypothetical protein
MQPSAQRPSIVLGLLLKRPAHSTHPPPLRPLPAARIRGQIRKPLIHHCLVRVAVLFPRPVNLVFDSSIAQNFERTEQPRQMTFPLAGDYRVVG